MEDQMTNTILKAFLITLLKVVEKAKNTKEVEEHIKSLLEVL